MFFFPTLTLVVQQPTVDLTTPEKALASFITAFNTKDRSTLVSCVLGGKDSPILDQLFVFANGKPPRFAVANVVKKNLTGDRAQLEYVLSASGGGEAMKPTRDRIDLQKTEGGWKLVPTDPRGVGAEGGMLGNLALVCAYPKALERARTMARATGALSNMKQVLIAGLLHLNDYDDKYLLTPANFVRALTPYLKTKSHLTSPLDPPGTVSFSINPNLTPETFPKLKRPEQTVWFFEGKQGDLKFRYDGKALIGFCDGHATLIARDQAKLLLWK